MKRKIVVIIIMLILLVILSLYYTYAINIDMSLSSGTADLLYNININDISGTSITLTVRIKPNVRSWRYNPVTNFYKVIDDMDSGGNNNTYGLIPLSITIYSYMMKNLDCGAVAYLTNSKYGGCSNNS